MWTTKSFANIHWHNFAQIRSSKIKEEVNSQSKEYILNIDEDQYIDYLYNKYLLEELKIDFNKEIIKTPRITKTIIEDRIYGKVEVEGYIFTILYPYTGTFELFEVIPSTRTLTTYQIFIDKEKRLVGFELFIDKKDPEIFEREKTSCRNSSFVNIDNINKDVKNWNDSLRNMVNQIFKTEKEKYISENVFFKAINLKVNQDTNTIFTVPTIKKAIIPMPELQKEKKYYNEPTMNPTMYDDVLKVIYEAGKSMEKKSSLYQGKDEEGLRDQFLFILETRYEGVTATGETFNKSGKTDILLRYAKDNSNLFVAECKFWRGESEYHNAIDQLFERYLTWRDSKTALIFFVKNQGFSSVLLKIKEESKKHKLFCREVGNRGESSFSYEFCLPQDNGKNVFLEVIAFHFDK